MSPMKCIIIITIGCILFIGTVATVKNARVIRKSEQNRVEQEGQAQTNNVPVRKRTEGTGNPNNANKGMQGSLNSSNDGSLGTNTNATKESGSDTSSRGTGNEGTTKEGSGTGTNENGSGTNTQGTTEGTSNRGTSNNGTEKTQSTAKDSSSNDVQETTSEKPLESLVAVKVDKPKLGELRTTSGMVSSKGIYRISNSYCYNVTFVVPTTDGGYGEIVYYCPKSTYDKVVIGSTLNIDFQYDEDGNISVNSIHD